MRWLYYLYNSRNFARISRTKTFDVLMCITHTVASVFVKGKSAGCENVSHEAQIDHFTARDRGLQLSISFTVRCVRGTVRTTTPNHANSSQTFPISKSRKRRREGGFQLIVDCSTNNSRQTHCQHSAGPPSMRRLPPRVLFLRRGTFCSRQQRRRRSAPSQDPSG